MEKEQGTHFDPELLVSFFKFIEKENRDFQYDPVCGMRVNQTESSFMSSYRNQFFIFCSKTCLQEFNRFPEKYTKKEAANIGFIKARGKDYICAESAYKRNE